MLIDQEVYRFISETDAVLARKVDGVPEAIWPKAVVFAEWARSGSCMSDGRLPHHTEEAFVGSFLLLKLASRAEHICDERLLAADLTALAVTMGHSVMPSITRIDCLVDRDTLDEIWDEDWEEIDDPTPKKLCYRDVFARDISHAMPILSRFISSDVVQSVRLPVLRNAFRMGQTLTSIAKTGQAKLKDAKSIASAWFSLWSELLMESDRRRLSLPSRIRFKRSRHAYYHLRKAELPEYRMYDEHRDTVMDASCLLSALRQIDQDEKYMLAGRVMESLQEYPSEIRDAWFGRVAQKAARKLVTMRALGRGLSEYKPEPKKTRKKYALDKDVVPELIKSYRRRGRRIAEAATALRSAVGKRYDRKLLTREMVRRCKSVEELPEGPKRRLREHLRELRRVWRFRWLAVEDEVTPYLFAIAHLYYEGRYELKKLADDPERSRGAELVLVKEVKNRARQAYRQMFPRKGKSD